jgi:hypothetical protein
VTDGFRPAPEELAGLGRVRQLTPNSYRGGWLLATGTMGQQRKNALQKALSVLFQLLAKMM